MLIESQEKNGTSSRIKCGNCKSEYTPRSTLISDTTAGQKWNTDFSCPVCGHGKFQESFVKKGKQILHD